MLLVAMNLEKKPFDDRRVRRALTLALDRWEASRNLSRIAIVKEVAGIQVPGTPWATPPQELEKQWHRIIPHSARARGWTITPAHFLNNQLDTVWLAE